MVVGALASLSGGSGAASGAILYSPVVTVVGNGNPTTSGVGYTTSIATYLPNVAAQAGPQGILAFNSSASGSRLVTSASATSESTLTNNPGVSDAAALGLSFAGTVYTYSAGYDAADGTASVNSSGTNANRSLGRATLSGYSVTGATVLQTQATAYNNNNIRGATGDDSAVNPAIYSAGTGTTASTAGWRNFSSNSQLSTTPTNVRTVELLGGKMFGSTGSGTTGIYLVDPAGVTAASLFIGTTSSPYEFALFNDTSNASATLGYNTCYVTDDAVGIQKYVYNGSAWTLAYTLKETGVNYRGLAGQKDAATGLFTLFVSTADGTKLEQVTDNGTAASAAFTTLATAAPNTVFRGVALTIPAPGSLALLGFGGLVALRRRR
jgi:hypothetical protein